MKKLSALLSLGLLGLVATNCFATDWLEGEYINQDKDSFMHEATFCKNGKAYAGLSPREYSIVTKDGADYVVLKSNGVFTFKISSDKKELFPSDAFTKEWFTKKSLKLDPTKKDPCNW